MNGPSDSAWKELCKAFPRVMKGVRVERTIRPLKEGESQPPFICGAFSPDGSMLALSGGGRIPSSPAIWVVKVPGFETVAVLRGHQGIHDLAWDPVTGLLASASNDYCVVAWDVPRGDHLFICGGDGEPIVKGAVAFGNNVLYVGESEPFEDLCSRLLRVDLISGKIAVVHELARENGKRIAINHVAVNPATDRWAFTADDFDHFDRPIVMRGKGTEEREQTKLPSHARAVAWNGDRILFASAPDGARGAVTFAPDGTKIEASKGELRTPSWTTKLDAKKDLSLVRCSRDGTRIVVAGFDLLALVDAKNGQVLETSTPPAWFRS